MLWDTPDSLLDEEVIKKPAELDDASYEALVRAEFHGVHVGNEHDVRCLVRLLEHVPLHKVIRSVQLQELKWPGRRLYVTKLLKRYHVKAPPRVPANVPLPRIYLLVHVCSCVTKIGVTNDWLKRVYSMASRVELPDFDRTQSVCFDLGLPRSELFKIESRIKRELRPMRAPPPACLTQMNKMPTEWFAAEAYLTLRERIEQAGPRVVSVVTLGDALVSDLLAPGDRFWPPLRD